MVLVNPKYKPEPEVSDSHAYKERVIKRVTLIKLKRQKLMIPILIRRVKSQSVVNSNFLFRITKKVKSKIILTLLKNILIF